MFLHDYRVLVVQQKVIVKKGLPFQYEESFPNLLNLSSDELDHLYNEAFDIVLLVDGERRRRDGNDTKG